MLASELTAVCQEEKVRFAIDVEHPTSSANLYVLTVQYREDVFSEWFVQCVNECRKMNGVVCVCGKSSAVEYRYILKYTNADYVFLGEAEETLREILHIIDEREQDAWWERIHSVDGVAYKVGDRIIKTAKRRCRSSMDDLPYPKYEYLTRRDIYRLCVMETSRSCHGKCNFCEGYLFRNFVERSECRAKSPRRVIEEIKYVIDTYSCRVFSFSDDNFLMDGNIGKQRAVEIANLLDENKIKIRFTIECRADDIDYETFRCLKRAGLIKVFVGIESGSQAVLDRYNKGTTVEDNHKAIQILNELGIQCHPGHILFDPKTTDKELWDTVNFFEPYLDTLFSFEEGESDRLLYYPQGCSIVRDFWPNRNEQYYEKVWYKGVECEFEHEKTSRIFALFSKYIKDSALFQNTNILQRRILCLKKALIDVEGL